jgi:hypothetical protein
MLKFLYMSHFFIYKFSEPFHSESGFIAYCRSVGDEKEASPDGGGLMTRGMHGVELIVDHPGVDAG